jgi:hypoxanthine phosphoribosyltransferase
MEKIKVLISNKEIKQRVKELAADIKRNFGENIYCVIVLTGAIVFFVDLMNALRELGACVTFTPIKVSSYKGKKSTHEINLELGIDEKISGKRLLIVEDIIDTGMTLDFLRNYLLEKKPKEVKICTLLDKKVRREKDIKIDYVGFEVPDKFVIGYGIDYEQKYRDLSYIGIID